MKLTFLDIGLAIDTYINSRERTIREQREAIQDLPTPVLRLREGMLLVPIIGLIDSQRAGGTGEAPVLVGYLNSDVLMVQSAQDWQGEHAPYPVSVTRNRCILL